MLQAKTFGGGRKMHEVREVCFHVGTTCVVHFNVLSKVNDFLMNIMNVYVLFLFDSYKQSRSSCSVLR